MTSSPQPPGGNGEASVPDGSPGFGQHVDRIGEDAQRLWSDTRGAVNELGQSLDIEGRLQRHPYATLAAAVGVGYVLGGGLFTSLTARILRLGLRVAALPMVKDELVGMAEAALRGYQATAPRPAEDSGTSTPRSPGPQGPQGIVQ